MSVEIYLSQGGRNICEYGNHEMKNPHDCYCYSDPDNGVAENTRICKMCYCKHLQKYYPDSRVAKHMRKYPEYWGLPEVSQPTLLEAK